MLDIFETVEPKKVCHRHDRLWKPKCRHPVHGVFVIAVSFPKQWHVNAVSNSEVVNDVQDQQAETLTCSGPDAAAIISSGFAGCGRYIDGKSQLVDCQGNERSVSELREFALILKSTTGHNEISCQQYHVL